MRARPIATPPAAPPDALGPDDVLRMLAHRYPLLLVDRIDVVQPGRRVVGRKRVTGGEWLCAASEAAGAAMPGLLMVEALAQTAGGVLIGLADGAEGAVGYFVALERVRFRGVVRAGESLDLSVELRQFRRGMAKLRGAAHADGRFVVSADFTTVLRAGPRSADPAAR